MAATEPRPAREGLALLLAVAVATVIARHLDPLLHAGRSRDEAAGTVTATTP